MCKETIDVADLNNQRTAYEVEQFLSGIPSVERVQADFLDSSIVVEYDESELSHDTVLDYIEHAGCTPSDRASGVMHRLKTKFSRT
jgi:copper chaperone CopZ